MFLTVHATLGALIGQYSDNIGLAFAAGFFSHFVLDIIPHGDENLIAKEKSNLTRKDIVSIIKIASMDGLVMMILLAIIFWRHITPLTLPVLAGVIGSIAPDFINGFYVITKFPWLKKYSDFHFSLHYLAKIQLSFAAGFIVQLVIITSLIIASIIF